MTCCAAGARSSDAEDPERVLVGETYVLDLDQLMPFYGTGEDELNLAFNFLFVHAPLDAERAAHDRRGRRGEAARRRLARVGGLEPRRQAARDALGAGRPGPRAGRAADAAHAARDAVPLLRRRARPARRALGPADRARPGRAADGGRGRQPRRLPHADAVERRAGRRLHDAGRDAVARVRRPRRAQRGGPARRPGLDAPPRPRPDRAAPRRARPHDGRLRDAARAGRRVGVVRAGTGTSSRSTCRTATSSSTASPGGSRSPPTARATARRSTGSALGAWEGAVVVRR